MFFTTLLDCWQSIFLVCAVGAMTYIYLSLKIQRMSINDSYQRLRKVEFLQGYGDDKMLQIATLAHEKKAIHIAWGPGVLDLPFV